MNWLRLLAVGLIVLLYLISPIDLIPDMLPGLGRLDDVLVLLGFLWWVRDRKRPTPPRRPTAPPEAAADVWDPYAVLGVTHDATADEITHAYREQMKLYHPDRVAGLGEELQQLAHRKAVDIQRAYAEIGKP